MIITTIDDYLARLRQTMRHDDRAVVQDALYDAEEYLRAELAHADGRAEADVLAEIVASYGAPEEVADAYRQTERTVSAALRTPPRTPPASALGAVFGVFVDPRTYGSMFYMLLALATGVLYFTAAVTGLSVSVGLAVTIVGIPFFLLFLAIVRVLSLVEGRVVEAMLDVRMPRRPIYRDPDNGIWARIGRMFTDPRTWTTLLYMILQLPLGILYFTIVAAGLSLSLALLFAPLGLQLGATYMWFDGGYVPGMLHAWVMSALGGILLIVTLHVCRATGRVHGWLAKYLLVRY